MEIKILIVEDTPTDIQSYQDTITTLNLELASSEIIINAEYARNKEEGLSIILTKKDELDGAFIDLKLREGTSIDVNEGNELIGLIYKKLRFPVFVLTNTPNAFDSQYATSEFLQLRTKTDIDYRDIILSLIKIHKTGITRILGRKGLIEEMLDNIFWDNISKTLNEWKSIHDCEKSLLRYILAHLQEHLEISRDRTEFETVYPIESYIKPSIKKYFFTGDIIYKKDTPTERFVIMNPACDMAPHGERNEPKATHIIIAELQEYNNTPLKSLLKKIKVEKNEAYSEDDISKAKNNIMNIITNNASPQYYYLPDTDLTKGGLINFQRLNAIKFSDLKIKYEKEATITSSFVKDIIAKFSIYYSRQGSPDFDFHALFNKLVAD